MITASIESLCAIAHTPTAKTLKFAHVKATDGHTILPLKETHKQDRFLHTPGELRAISQRMRHVGERVDLNQEYKHVSVCQKRREIPQVCGKKACAHTHQTVSSQCTSTMAWNREGQKCVYTELRPRTASV